MSMKQKCIGRINRNVYISTAVIFIVAIVFRIFLISIMAPSYLGGQDAIGYHNKGVRLAHGSGYYVDKNGKIEPVFFTEPGYPYFVSIVYRIYELSGNPINPIDSMFYSHIKNPEITFLRIAQAILNAFSCIIFYFTLRGILKERHAFFITIVASLYMPFAYISLYISRESLQIFVLLCMNYFFFKFLLKEKLCYLMLFSIFWAISNYTLQITFLPLPIFIFVYVFYKFRSFIKSMKYTMISSLIMLILVSPWIIRAYRFYPNLKVVKSMGISLTHESLRFVSAVRKLTYYNFLTEEEGEKILFEEWYNIGEKERFHRSFNGYYINKANTINKTVNEPFFSKRKFALIWDRFRLSWVQNFFGNLHPSTQLNPIKRHWGQKRLPIIVLVLIASYIGIFGIFIFFREMYPILFIFIFNFSLFFILGSETRRMLVIHPFIIMFSYLMLSYIFKHFRKNEPLPKFRTEQ